MVFLSAIVPNPEYSRDGGIFPWSLLLARDLGEVRFEAPVRFLAGENGSGKSTLLEGIAAGMGAVAAGRRDLARDYGADPDGRSHGETFLAVLRKVLS